MLYVTPVNFREYMLQITVNRHEIKAVRIAKHYELKHGHYLNDTLILELVQSLDGEEFQADSKSKGIEYFAADVVHIGTDTKKKIYRLIWILATLTPEEIEKVTKKIAKKRNVPLGLSKQVNMRLSPETMSRAKHLAATEGKAVTSYLAALLKEDIERLWRVAQGAGKSRSKKVA